MALFRLLLLLSLISPFTWRAATDEGNGFDPHGTPRPASATCDDGNGLDPHGGRCTQTNSLDGGPHMDPSLPISPESKDLTPSVLTPGVRSPEFAQSEDLTPCRGN